MTNTPPTEQRFILYTSQEGRVAVNVIQQNETVWLTQKNMAELFDVEVNTINYHIKEIYNAAELKEDSTIRKIRIVQREASREVERETTFYNLDMIISVGYRVNSAQATKFRIWATQILKEYIIKGFALDDERLKRVGDTKSPYFIELIERIRDIRSSERLFYQKITDIYAQCSVDYDPSSETTQEFYATVQNKLHWAIHGHTAVELIVKRVDATKPKMGLTSWKNSPTGRICRSDVSIAKNYLNEDELRRLNRIVTMYLDYAENQAEKQRVMTMKDWAEKLDAFLQFNEEEILTNPGKVSAVVAKELAEKEFEKYEQQLRTLEASTPTSDFDKLVDQTKSLPDANTEEKKKSPKTPKEKSVEVTKRSSYSRKK